MTIDNNEIIEFIDLLDYTFSNKFIEKWRYKYSISFIKKFQYKILQSMSDKKPIKKKTLYQYLNKKCKYSTDQVDEFFDDVEIEIYYPLVM
jgi:hypothetical protein